MEWSTACPDWEQRIVRGQSLGFPPLFPSESAAALQVFNELRIADVIGQPKLGDVSRPWLNDLVSTIFGAYDTTTGQRLITEFFLLISKKNTKSTSAAGIMLTALLRNWRSSAEFLILAPTVEIANNSFYPARDAVRLDEELSDLLQVQDHYRTITHRTTNATLKIVAAENEAVGGKKATGVLVDELWLFGKRPGAENMLREATGGLASRPEGFTIFLSTQSDEAPAGVFAQKLQYARGVRDGRINDPRFFPMLYEFPDFIIKAEEHRNPKNFYMTNPNMGASVSEDYLVREMSKAEEAGEESVIGFMAKHLNVEVGLALKSARWAGADFWAACGQPTLDLEEVIRRSDVLCAGVDGGGLDDLLGLAIMGRDAETGEWLHWAHAWIHPIVLQRQKATATRFKDLQAVSCLTIVENAGEDIEQVAKRIDQCEKSGLLERIGVDVSGIGAIVDAIIALDIQQDRIVGIPQGWKMVGAIKTTERKLAAKQFIHGASPLMDFAVGSAKVEPRGNAIVITKQASGNAKIDPLMATFNAVTLLSMNPQPKKKAHQLFFV